MSNQESSPAPAAPTLQSLNLDHDYFLDLLRDIQSACEIEASTDAAEIELVISSLTGFFLEHFAREEEMMTSLRYPEFHQHKELHHEMAFHLRMLGERVTEKHSCTMLHDFCTFFIDWLLQHDKAADAKFRDFALRLLAEQDAAPHLADSSQASLAH
jgi:hemerythrin